MADPTSEQLDQLLALADTDGQIRRKRKQLDGLPEQQQLDEAEAELRELVEEHGDRSLERDRIQALASKEDREVDILREHLSAEQQRLYGGDITNAKELDSMKAEIAAVEERIDQHETAELEALEQVEAIESEMAELTTRADEARVRIAELTEARDTSAKALLAEIAELEVSLAAQRDPLPDDLLARYDGSAATYGALAIGRLEGDGCTACGITLSYADLNELVEGPPLSTCPSCGRLIVV